MKTGTRARRASPSSLSLEAFRSQNKSTTATCGLTRFLTTLSAKDQATTRAAIIDPSIQCSAIARVLKPLGYHMTYQVITRHRRVGCSQCGINT